MVMFDALRPRRSALYLPANRESAVAKARTLAADCVILDLEDAVQPDAKEAARAAAVAAAAAGGWACELLVRVNGLSTAWCEADFAAVRAGGFAGVVVPKVGSAEEAARAVVLAGGLPVWAMIETPQGVLAAAEIAKADGVVGLLAGLGDLGKELRATPDFGRQAFLYSLSAMVVAARAAGKLVLDGVYMDVKDEAGLVAEARQGLAMGFDGKTLVHPAQVDPCNAVFSPSVESLEDARGLIEAYEAGLAEGRGVTTYKGRLIEVLHVADARRKLAFAELIAGRIAG
jgi:citrate lyase beta subunit